MLRSIEPRRAERGELWANCDGGAAMSEITLRVVTIRPEPLTAASFAEFGRVVGPEQAVLTSTEFPFFTNASTLQSCDLPITYVNRHHDHNQIFASFDGRPMV